MSQNKHFLQVGQHVFASVCMSLCFASYLWHAQAHSVWECLLILLNDQSETATKMQFYNINMNLVMVENSRANAGPGVTKYQSFPYPTIWTCLVSRSNFVKSSPTQENCRETLKEREWSYVPYILSFFGWSTFGYQVILLCQVNSLIFKYETWKIYIWVRVMTIKYAM